MNKTKSYRVIDIIFNTSLIIVLIGFIIRKQPRFIANLIAIFICYIIIISIERITKVKIPYFISVLLMLTVLIHLILGQYFSLYYTSPWFDNTLHILGSFSFSLFYYYIMTTIFKGLPRSLGFKFTFIVLLGITGGTLFEVLEFILDILLNTNNQHSLMDTNLDIIFNILGSILCGVFVISKE